MGLPRWTYAGALLGVGLANALFTACGGNSNSTPRPTSTPTKAVATQTYRPSTTATETPYSVPTPQKSVYEIKLINSGNAAAENSILIINADGDVEYTYNEPEGGFFGSLKGAETYCNGVLPPGEQSRLQGLISESGFPWDDRYGGPSDHGRSLSWDINGTSYSTSISGMLTQLENPESPFKEDVPQPLENLIVYLESSDGPAGFAKNCRPTGNIYDATK